MNNLLCLAASYLINSFWEVAAIGGTGWVVSRVVKRLGPQAQHITWVATLGLAAVTPLLPLCRSLLGPALLDGMAGHRPSAVSVVGQAGHSIISGAIFLPPFLIAALSLFYLCALLYFVARLSWQLHRTITLVREAEPVSLGPENDELWNHAKRAFPVEDALILKSRQISGPVTIQFIRPVLLLPEEFTTSCTQDDLLAALAHECAHIKRRDFQKNLFYEIAALFIAFHPVTWIVKSQIAQTREMICDGMATEKLVDGQTYARSLLRLVAMIPFAARPHTSNAMGIYNDANILEKRIMMIRTKKQHLTLTLRYWLVLSGALFLFVVAGGCASMTRSIKPQAAGAPVTPDPVRKGHPCTYYDPQGVEYPGTCGAKKGDTQAYCFSNGDRKLSELQPACAVQLGR